MSQYALLTASLKKLFLIFKQNIKESLNFSTGWGLIALDFYTV